MAIREQIRLLRAAKYRNIVPVTIEADATMSNTRPAWGKASISRSRAPQQAVTFGAPIDIPMTRTFPWRPSTRAACRRARPAS